VYEDNHSSSRPTRCAKCKKARFDQGLMFHETDVERALRVHFAVNLPVSLSHKDGVQYKPR